jgi:hypothetical protein
MKATGKVKKRAGSKKGAQAKAKAPQGKEHRAKFDQLLDDAIFGVKKKRKG